MTKEDCYFDFSTERSLQVDIQIISCKTGPAARRRRTTMGAPQKLKRNQKIIQLRKSGATFQQIADRFNISRQCAFKIYKRARIKGSASAKHDAQ